MGCSQKSQCCPIHIIQVQMLPFVPASFSDFFPYSETVDLIYLDSNPVILQTDKSKYEYYYLTIRRIKIHLYRKRQTSDSSREFLRMENKQIETVLTIPVDKTGINLLIFCVEPIKSKRMRRKNLGILEKSFNSIFP